MKLINTIFEWLNLYIENIYDNPFIIIGCISRIESHYGQSSNELALFYSIVWNIYKNG